MPKPVIREKVKQERSLRKHPRLSKAEYYQSKGRLPPICCMVCKHFRFESATSPQALCRVRSNNPPLPAKYYPKELGQDWDTAIPKDCTKFKEK